MWLTDALRRLKPVLSTGTTLVESLEAPDTAVKIEPGRLDQVLLNLLLNANDAAGPDAVVVVRSRLVDGDGPTKTVQIEVEDDGQGIDASVRSTLFEPFVTTKAGKGGTGLGLAVSSQLVESLGGALSYHGYENRGAVFRITLPEFGANLERETSPSDSDAGIGAHVLLVDDQQSVLAVMGEALRTAGFQTMECVDSTSAWKYFEWADVLITDLTMPDVDGVALSERFRRECPGRPVAIVSGFIPEDMALSVADAVLLKPFRLSELVETTAQLAVRGDRGRSDVLESAS